MKEGIEGGVKDIAIVYREKGKKEHFEVQLNA